MPISQSNIAQKRFNIKIFFAFTLAEVLITLGIIGVIAAMVIPPLQSNIKDQETVSKIKKAYSILSEAYTQTIQDNGTPDTWGITTDGDLTQAVTILNKFLPYMKVSKTCTNTTDTSCFPSSYLYLDGTSTTNKDYTCAGGTCKYARTMLADGSTMATYAYAGCNTNLGPTTDLKLSSLCGVIVIDVNGFKLPNRIGDDLFQFYISTVGITPAGMPQQTVAPFKDYCKPSGSQDGLSCTAWVLYNENLDYKKCALDWGGTTTCP